MTTTRQSVLAKNAPRSDEAPTGDAGDAGPRPGELAEAEIVALEDESVRRGGDAELARALDGRGAVSRPSRGEGDALTEAERADAGRRATTQDETVARREEEHERRGERVLVAAEVVNRSSAMGAAGAPPLAPAPAPGDVSPLVRGVGADLGLA